MERPAACSSTPPAETAAGSSTPPTATPSTRCAHRNPPRSNASPRLARRVLADDDDSDADATRGDIDNSTPGRRDYSPPPCVRILGLARLPAQAAVRESPRHLATDSRTPPPTRPDPRVVDRNTPTPTSAYPPGYAFDVIDIDVPHRVPLFAPRRQLDRRPLPDITATSPPAPAAHLYIADRRRQQAPECCPASTTAAPADTSSPHHPRSANAGRAWGWVSHPSRHRSPPPGNGRVTPEGRQLRGQRLESTGELVANQPATRRQRGADRRPHRNGNRPLRRRRTHRRTRRTRPHSPNGSRNHALNVAALKLARLPIDRDTSATTSSGRATPTASSRRRHRSASRRPSNRRSTKPTSTAPAASPNQQPPPR
jgi:hypothetical protein